MTRLRFITETEKQGGEAGQSEDFLFGSESADRSSEPSSCHQSCGPHRHTCVTYRCEYTCSGFNLCCF